MSSPAMEKEGLIRCLKALDEEGVVVDVLVTDQHLSIAKMMREEIPSIRHYYDAWHVVKGEVPFI